MSLSVENKSLPPMVNILSIKTQALDDFSFRAHGMFLTLYADTTLYCYQKMIRYNVARHCADTLISMFQNNLCEIVATAYNEDCGKMRWHNSLYR
jgi:hypothetical protein